MFLSLKSTLKGLRLTKNGCRMVENVPSLSHRSFPPFSCGPLRETGIISSSRWHSDVRVSHLETFKEEPNPFQPCGFKIEPPGSHCQLALSLGFVTVQALTSSPSKFGPPHWLGHGLRPCPSANLAGQLLPNPGRSLAKNSSGKPKLGWPGINASARRRGWCPGSNRPTTEVTRPWSDCIW